MRAMKVISLPIAIVLLTTMLTVPSSAIVIRHDLDPGIYGAQGSEYPSVMTFLWPAEEGTAETASLSATLLSRDWAVTAAHGADEFAQRTLRIEVAGVIYEDVSFDLWLPHPCFDDAQGDHDIGLVHFPDPPWPAMDSYPQLYREDDELGKVVVFVGRGAPGTGEDGSDGDVAGGPFRNATNTIDHVDGATIGFTFNAPEEAESSPLEGISGDGDSGGPAFMCGELSLDPLGRISCSMGLKLLGVSSYQDRLADDDSIGVYGVTERYTRVSTHRAWIESTMASRRAGACSEAMLEHEVSGRTAEQTGPGGCQGSSQPPLAALLLLICAQWIRRKAPQTCRV